MEAPAVLRINVFDEVKVTESPLEVVYVAPRKEKVKYTRAIAVEYSYNSPATKTGLTLTWPPSMARAPSFDINSNTYTAACSM